MMARTQTTIASCNRKYAQSNAKPIKPFFPDFLTRNQDINIIKAPTSIANNANLTVAAVNESKIIFYLFSLY